MNTYVIAYNYCTLEVEAETEQEAIEWFETEIQQGWDHIWEESPPWEEESE